MAQEKNIWKFNDDEWKVHIDKKEVCDKLDTKFKLKTSTVYYETGVLSKETSLIVCTTLKRLLSVFRSTIFNLFV